MARSTQPSIPRPVTALEEHALPGALRACGLRTTSQHRLKFEQLCSAIDQRRPVLVIIHNPGAEAAHWVVVYGYGRFPDQVFIAVNGLPWFGGNRLARREFERIWVPRGNGIICSNNDTRPRRTPTPQFNK